MNLMRNHRQSTVLSDKGSRVNPHIKGSAHYYGQDLISRRRYAAGGSSENGKVPIHQQKCMLLNINLVVFLYLFDALR